MKYMLGIGIIAVAISVGVATGLQGKGKSVPNQLTTTVEVGVVPQLKEDTKSLTKKIKVKSVNITPDNTVFLNSEVDTISVDLVIAEISRLKDNTDKIYLLIDSPGGSVIDGARLAAFIEASQTPIYTVCVGICASMAAHLHQTGKERLMVDKTVLMFHPARGGAQGTLEQMGSLLKMLQLYVDRMDANAARRSGIPYDELKKRISTDYWVEARDAIDEKLCDGIVTLDIDMTQINLNINEKAKLLRTNKTNEKKSLSHLYDIR